MTIPSWLKSLSAPHSIALIGASNDPMRVSGRALAFLSRYEYAGAVYPVNRRSDVVQGLPAFASVDDTPTVPDLALISLPAHQVRGALQQCADRGVTTAIVYASGFAEQDADGVQAQGELRAICDASPIRVLGPNCLGAVSPAGGVMTTFATAFDDGALDPGPVALLTQSGAFASFVYGAGRSVGVKFGFLATTGNEVDLTLGEVLGGVVEMDDISSVLMHIEGIRDLPRFQDAAQRARELGKQIAVIKVGRSLVGARAARAHTAADAGDDAVYDDMFDELGIHRVDSMEALVDVGQVFQAGSQPRGDRAVIVSVSGGTGVLMADVAAQCGLEVPELGAELREQIQSVLPPFASTRNPVDVTGAVFDDLDRFKHVLTTCAADEATDVMLVAVGNAVATEDLIVDAIRSATATSVKPVIVTWVGGSGVPAQILNSIGIPTYGDPNRAVKAASVAVRAGREAARR